MYSISPPVVYYHSVAPAYFEDWGLKYLTQLLHHFEGQLRYLETQGMRSIFLDEWLAIRKGEAKSTGKEICLTFDDGFLDNWVYAYPLAKKYGHRFTLFVNPECVDPRSVCRLTLEDVWEGRCQESELEARGFVSWQELREMQASGIVDVQSHTMSHDKYIASSDLKSFYYGGANGIYPIWNAFPEQKPFYLSDPGFTAKLNFGTPLFAENSAVSVRRHRIAPDFLQDANQLAQTCDLNDQTERVDYEKKIKDLHGQYLSEKKLVQEIETLASYQKRLRYEILDSKTILEKELNKPIQFLCWPHGDNTLEAHTMAKKAGYLATTSGKRIDQQSALDRIPRIGVVWRHFPILNRLKFHYKIASHYQRPPYHFIYSLNEWKNKWRR